MLASIWLCLFMIKLYCRHVIIKLLLGFVFALHLHLIFFYKIIYSVLQSVKRSFLLPSLIFFSASVAFRDFFDFEKFNSFFSLIISRFSFKESPDLVAFSFQILHHFPLLCKNPNHYTWSNLPGPPFLTAAHNFFLNVFKTVTENINLKLPFYHQICCFESEDNFLTQHFPFTMSTVTSENFIRLHLLFDLGTFAFEAFLMTTPIFFLEKILINP